MINQDTLENQANRIYLGIGSNLGNRRYKIEQAKYELSLRNIRLVKSSNFYESLSWPDERKPKYLNIVLEVISDLKPLELLKVVLDKHVDLVCNWMRVGFVHGVMNTDNMTISGETIDYGPCAFMDTYDPSTVFSSIDKNGRYAYFNQPLIVKWNLERFAECLLPLIAVSYTHLTLPTKRIV